MRIVKRKYSSWMVFIVVGLLISGGLSTCKIADEIAPVLTLNGSDSLEHPLNEIYDDAGATATDDTDGTLTGSIFVESNVNEDFLGFYEVVYSVVDQAGNSAIPLTRSVEVINYARSYIGNYKAKEFQVFGQDTCSYDVFFNADSTVNYRMIFDNFACEVGLNVYANLDDTLIVIPHQTIEDSIRKVSFQGSGYINDTLIFVDYKRTENLTITYWNAMFNKQPE